MKQHKERLEGFCTGLQLDAIHVYSQPWTRDHGISLDCAGFVTKRDESPKSNL